MVLYLHYTFGGSNGMTARTEVINRQTGEPRRMAVLSQTYNILYGLNVPTLAMTQ